MGTVKFTSICFAVVTVIGLSAIALMLGHTTPDRMVVVLFSGIGILALTSAYDNFK